MSMKPSVGELIHIGTADTNMELPGEKRICMKLAGIGERNTDLTGAGWRNMKRKGANGTGGG